jgi:hypothetical protein
MDWRCQGARQLHIVLLGVATAQVTYDNPNITLFKLLLDYSTQLFLKTSLVLRRIKLLVYICSALAAPSASSDWLTGLHSPLIQEDGEEKKLKLRFDVSQYTPEEIVVKTVDNKLMVTQYLIKHFCLALTDYFLLLTTGPCQTRGKD